MKVCSDMIYATGLVFALAVTSVNGVPLTKRIAQTISASTAKWEAACRAAGGDQRCNPLAVSSAATLLAAAGPCDQQDSADKMIDLAKELKNDAAMIKFAQIFAQQPRNTPNSVAVPYCQKEPKNPELKGLFQCQFQGANQKKFVGDLQDGAPGTKPLGQDKPLDPLGSCPAHPSGPIADGSQLVDIVQDPTSSSTNGAGAPSSTETSSGTATSTSPPTTSKPDGAPTDTPGQDPTETTMTMMCAGLQPGATVTFTMPPAAGTTSPTTTPADDPTSPTTTSAADPTSSKKTSAAGPALPTTTPADPTSPTTTPAPDPASPTTPAADQTPAPSSTASPAPPSSAPAQAPASGRPAAPPACAAKQKRDVTSEIQANLLIAQPDLPAVAKSWQDLCLASGGDIETDAPCVKLAGLDGLNALLAGADPCAQQDNADKMIDFANSPGIKNKDALTANAIAYRKHPRNALDIGGGLIPSTPFCTRAPRNPELKDVVNEQLKGVNPGLFGGPKFPVVAFGAPGTCPFGQKPDVATCSCK